MSEVFHEKWKHGYAEVPHLGGREFLLVAIESENTQHTKGVCLLCPSNEARAEDVARARLIEQAPALLQAIKETRKEFERLKDAVMKREDMPFIAKARDAVYLDAVLAVIDSKTSEILTHIESTEA